MMPNEEYRECRICGKRLKGLQGITIEQQNGDAEGWKTLQMPLCKEHREELWRAIKKAIGRCWE